MDQNVLYYIFQFHNHFQESGSLRSKKKEKVWQLKPKTKTVKKDEKKIKKFVEDGEKIICKDICFIFTFDEI